MLYTGILMYFTFAVFSNQAMGFTRAMPCQHGLLPITIQTDKDRLNSDIASVLIKSKGAKLPGYLHKRKDGWAHLTSKSYFSAGNAVTNCFQNGTYEIRIEYYQRVNYLGFWLTDAYLLEASPPAYIVSSGNRPIPQSEIFKFNLSALMPLLIIYGASAAVIIVSLYIIVTKFLSTIK